MCASRRAEVNRSPVLGLDFRVSCQQPAELMDGLAGPLDLGARLFDDFLGQWLATATADFQQALKPAQIISGSGKTLAQLMAQCRARAW